ncbi:MAG: hypothetical protein WCX48_09785 [Bacteroidales bacterium]
MKSITLEEAKKLSPGMWIYHRTEKDSKGEPKRWKVSGQPVVWKKTPEKVEVPIKYGMYTNSRLTERNLYYFSMTNY